MKKYLLPLILILLLAFTLVGNCAWLSGYDKRIKLTIDNTKVDAALSDFPVTIFFTSTQAEEIFTEFDADADYMKCAFTTSDGTTQLYAENELFDDSAQKAVYHVKVTSVASGADTDIYYYYDDDHADNTTYIGAINTTAGGHVWDSNFKGVHHLEGSYDGTASEVKDSTSNNYDGTAGGNPTQYTTSKIDTGQDLDGVDDRIEFPIRASMANGSVEWVIYLDQINQVDNNTMFLQSRYDSNGDDVGAGSFQIDSAEAGLIRVLVRDASSWAVNYSSSADSIAVSNWYHVVITWHSTNGWATYINGSADGTDATVQAAFRNTKLLIIGTMYQTSPPLWKYEIDGRVDEFRISDTTRGAAWIKATYNSLWDSLLTYGSEETSAEDNAIFMGTNF